MSNTVKIYIEQNAFELLENCQSQQNEEQQIFYLLGREYHLGLQRVFVIRSILEGAVQEETALQVSPEELRSVDQHRSMQYPHLRFIGWALHQPGHGVKALSRHNRCHMQYFRQTSVLLLQDPQSASKEVYYWNGSSFQNTGGYMLYKEQELDMDLSDEGTPIELWSDPEPHISHSKPASNSMLGRALRENSSNTAPSQLTKDDTPPRLSYYTKKEALPRYTERSKEPRQFEGQLQSIVEPDTSSRSWKQRLSHDGSLHTLSLLTSISAIVLLITVITGALMFHNISTLTTIQNHIETINHRISYMEQSEIVIEEPAEE